MIASTPVAWIPASVNSREAAISSRSRADARAGSRFIRSTPPTKATGWADRRRSAREKTELRRVLTERRFFPVFQPIVSLGTRKVVGHEALTRFVDGTEPASRFARAGA